MSNEGRMDKKARIQVNFATTAEIRKEWEIYAAYYGTSVTALIHQAMTALIKGAGDDVKAELKAKKERNGRKPPTADHLLYLFSYNLVRLRKLKGLTQDAASIALDMCSRTYSRYEQAERLPTAAETCPFLQLF